MTKLEKIMKQKWLGWLEHLDRMVEPICETSTALWDEHGIDSQVMDTRSMDEKGKVGQQP